MHIAIAASDDEILACFATLRQLRPKLNESTFVADVRRMQPQGYILASVRDPDVRGVAGYRYYEMFAFGPQMYIDDLVTDAAYRSHGYGKAMLDWLRAEAVRNRCSFMTLDSGHKRKDAHRFYLREGMEDVALHFVQPLGGGPMWTSD
jgi:GNAT superfamily N-acetyltransferase